MSLTPNTLATTLPDPTAVESVGRTAMGALTLLGSYTHVFVLAFLGALISTPIVRKIAIRADIIDHPDAARKAHKMPVAYLGGVAVFIGLLLGIAGSYLWSESAPAYFESVPFAVLIGMFAIMFTGLADDVWGWDPRLKIAGQLVAAAALAIENVGVRVAEGLLRPLFGNADEVMLTLGSFDVFNSTAYYWIGTAIIAIFVLGGCNATNLIDGLDGLLSGTAAIVAVGLLAICLMMATQVQPTPELLSEGSQVGARIVLCLALLGATLGFLPHNFNPATIFLGDCGSLLIGYMCVAIILMLGEQGQTHLVLAGLIVFSVPIIDTTLAIIRRILAGVPMSAPDDQHLHHMLKRSLGGVKRAVFAIYGIGVSFALVGIMLAALDIFTAMRMRMVYAFVLVLFGFIGVIAVKIARQRQIEESVQHLITPPAAEQKVESQATEQPVSPAEASSV